MALALAVVVVLSGCASDRRWTPQQLVLRSTSAHLLPLQLGPLTGLLRRTVLATSDAVDFHLSCWGGPHIKLRTYDRIRVPEGLQNTDGLPTGVRVTHTITCGGPHAQPAVSSIILLDKPSYVSYDVIAEPGVTWRLLVSKRYF
ncbi:hypothetical protein ACFQX7_25980 [Luedemannella flava]|uniref:hypothetical protein n=1 Tax=Luedemannella flava TaxID=349316 RepID=UPI0031CE20DC